MFQTLFRKLLDFVIIEDLKNSVHCFKLMNEILEKSNQNHVDIMKKYISNDVISKIMDQIANDDNNSVEDHLLECIFKFLSLILLKNLFTDKLDNKFIKKMLEKNLLSLTETVIQPQCKTTSSRKELYSFLIHLSKDNGVYINQIVDFFKEALSKLHWKLNNNADWSISDFTDIKRKGDHMGLKNLGCTCYMNSLFQQFFMISQFRNTLINCDFDDKEENLKDNVQYQLQFLLYSLANSQKQSFVAKEFCQSFKDFEGNPVNVMDQMDAGEFFFNLMDKTEEILKKTNQDIILKRTFGGLQCNELIGKGCPHRSERDETYFAIQLQVKGCKHIYESLDLFIQGEMLDGDNAYHCDKCDDKIATLKRACIKTLPNYLIVVLKRFEFNYDTMQKIKVNDYFEFPQELNLYKYSKDYLNDQEEQEEVDDHQQSIPRDKKPKSYYEYRLRGVVIHKGNADAGHYYSLIKETDNKTTENKRSLNRNLHSSFNFNTESEKEQSKWMEFNDEDVREFDITNLEKEAFGENEQTSTFDGKNNKRGANAYILWYERDQLFNEKFEKIDNLVDGLNFEKNRHENYLKKKLADENFEYFKKKVFCEANFQEFGANFLESLTNSNPETCIVKPQSNPMIESTNLPVEPYPQNYDINDENTWLNYSRMLICLYFKVVLRTADKTNLSRIHKLVKELLKKSEKLSLWLVYNMSEVNAIKEYLIGCPLSDIKYMVVGVLNTALKKICKNKKCESFTTKQIESLANSYTKNEVENKKNDKGKIQKKDSDIIEFENKIFDNWEKIIQDFIMIILNLTNYRKYKIDENSQEYSYKSEALKSIYEVIVCLAGIPYTSSLQMDLGGDDIIESVLYSKEYFLARYVPRSLIDNICASEYIGYKGDSSNSKYAHHTSDESTLNRRNVNVQQIRENITKDYSPQVSAYCKLYVLNSQEQGSKTYLKFANISDYNSKWKDLVKYITKRQALIDYTDFLVNMAKKFDKTFPVLRFIANNIKSEDEKEYWKYLGMWTQISTFEILDQESADDRIGYTFKMFNIFLEHGDFFVHNEMIIDFLFCLCAYHPSILKFASLSKKIMQKMKSIIEQLGSPNWIYQGSKVFKKKGYQLMSSTNVNAAMVEQKKLRRINRLKMVMTGEYEELKESYKNNPIEYQTHKEQKKLPIKSIVDFKVNDTSWKKAEIVENSGEIIRVSYYEKDEKISASVQYDSDRIANKDSETEEHKFDFEFFIEK